MKLGALGTTLLFAFFAMLASGQQQATAQGADTSTPPQVKTQDPAPAADQEPSDPYEELRKHAEKLQAAWQQAVKDADEKIPTYFSENACSRRIDPLIIKKRDAFIAWDEAEQFYVKKQGEDVLEMVKRSETQNADLSSVGFDFKGEIARLDAEILEFKNNLAKLPPDNPVYQDARDQLAENIKLDEDTKKNEMEAQEKGASSAAQFRAAVAFLNARKQYVEDMQHNVESFKIKTLGGYTDESRLYAAKCLKSKDIKR